MINCIALTEYILQFKKKSISLLISKIFFLSDNFANSF